MQYEIALNKQKGYILSGFSSEICILFYPGLYCIWLWDIRQKGLKHQLIAMFWSNKYVFIQI